MTRNTQTFMQVGEKGAQVNQATSPHRPTLRPWPRRNVLKQQWAGDLFHKVDAHIVENARGKSGRSAWRYSVRKILVHAEAAGITSEHGITPPWLASMPVLLKGDRWDRESRILLGRLLVKAGIWSQENYELLRKNVASVAPIAPSSDRPKSRMPKANPPKELCDLVFKLAQRCGLSTGQMQALRRTDIQPLGLNVVAAPSRVQRRNGKPLKRRPAKPPRVIPFGDGWDEIPKALIEAYLAAEHPIDYLFFCRSPRDKRKPISRQTLEAAIAVLEKSATVRSLRKRHFLEDFNLARDLRELRFHLRNVHGLSNVHVHQLISGAAARSRTPERKGFLAEAATFPVPAPYLVVAICASGVLPKSVVISPGVPERSFAKWTGLLGRYSVTVNWPTDFVRQLQGRGRRGERALRVLYWAAGNQWCSGRRMKPSRIGATIRMDRAVLEGFEMTNIEVIDAETGSVWAGALFEFRNRKRTVYVPLIEVMNGAAWRNQCTVCMHPQRAAIDSEIRQALAIEGRVKGLKRIATAWKVSYWSVLGHAGRMHPVPYRGEDARSHLGSEIASPVVQIPRSLTEKVAELSADALTVFPLLLSTEHRPQQSEVTVTSAMVEKTLGISLNENRLSLALADLRNKRCIANFSKAPSGFQIEVATLNGIRNELGAHRLV